MKLKNKTVVTGGAGFIGSHLVKKLIERGGKVIVVDDFSSGSKQNLLNLGIKNSDFELRELDLTNYYQASEGLKEAETVFHFAARVGGIKYLHEGEDSELLTLQENLAIDANVFRVCLEKKVKRIVYASSTAVYPMEKQYSAGAIFSEDDFSPEMRTQDPRFRFQMSINPDGGYGLAKLMGEIQLNWMKDVDIGIARIFNIYGVNEPLDEKSHAISDLICKAIIYPKKEFVVWGDGNQTRDYLYVSDCVDALVKLEEKISDYSHSPLIINIGSGRTTSLREIAEEVIKLSGKDIKAIYDLKKPVGPLSRTANIDRIKNLLGWQPKIGLEKGLENTYLWIKKIT